MRKRVKEFVGGAGRAASEIVLNIVGWKLTLIFRMTMCRFKKGDMRLWHRVVGEWIALRDLAGGLTAAIDIDWAYARRVILMYFRSVRPRRLCAVCQKWGWNSEWKGGLCELCMRDENDVRRRDA